MHDVHYLTLAHVNGKRGWIAPVELTSRDQRAACYVVPIHEHGRPFVKYELEYVTYFGQGKYSSKSANLHLQPNGHVLKAQLDGTTVAFHLRLVDGRPVVYEYVGSLTHPDFRLALAEIEPESEATLDSLYSTLKVAVVGCNPESHYGGMEPAK